MKWVLIVDDHEVVRDGIKKMLSEPGSTFQFGDAGSVSEAVALARASKWDVVVLDLSLAGRSGFEVLRELKEIRPSLPVLILSMHAEEQYVRRALKAGASGYITKDSPRQELMEAMNRVIGGGRYVSPPFAEMLNSPWRRDPDRPLHELLSDREFEVLKAIGRGKTVSEIAALLRLSDKTVSTFRARLLKKMNLKNNAELTRYAIENHLVD